MILYYLFVKAKTTDPHIPPQPPAQDGNVAQLSCLDSLQLAGESKQLAAPDLRRLGQTVVIASDWHQIENITFNVSF